MHMNEKRNVIFEFSVKSCISTTMASCTYSGRDVLYPWMTSPIGRGCAYHQISHNPSDCNGITYFDYDGFVDYPKNYFTE